MRDARRNSWRPDAENPNDFVLTSRTIALSGD